jgi:tetratricopeptide (TPR) repeat protein
VKTAIVLCAILAAAPAFAQTEAIERAKDLFKKGVTLYQEGDIEKALAVFLESRAAYRSSKNTINAALCLDRLGRYDEALEMYEQVMVFWAELDETERAALDRSIATLKEKVVTVDVTSNVDGDLYVDGHLHDRVQWTDAGQARAPGARAGAGLRGAVLRLAPLNGGDQAIDHGVAGGLQALLAHEQRSIHFP